MLAGQRHFHVRARLCLKTVAGTSCHRIIKLECMRSARISRGFCAAAGCRRYDSTLLRQSLVFSGFPFQSGALQLCSVSKLAFMEQRLAEKLTFHVSERSDYVFRSKANDVSVIHRVQKHLRRCVRRLGRFGWPKQATECRCQFPWQ
jgi:hypothetical protein